jgi:hypothetical protein
VDGDKTLKILKMVQEGFLSPEQGQRLISELQTGPEEPRTENPDLFRVVEDVGKTFAQGFESLFGFGQQAFKDSLGLGPQTIVLKVLDAEGTLERYQVSVPYKVFSALKPLLLEKPSVIVHPLQQIDFAALFDSLEAGGTGLVFEYVDRARDDRLEVWVR